MSIVGELATTIIGLLANHGVLIFPYFLGFTVLVLAFLFRDAEIVKHHGFQIIALAVLLPTVLFASHKGWHDVVALISALVGYIFGSEQTRSKESGKNLPA